MKKSTLLTSLLALLLMVSTGISAQKVTGKGPVVTQKVKMSDITEIGLGISADVYLSQGSSQSIEIKGQQNIIDLIKKEAKNGSWDIEFPKNSRVKMSEKLEIYITLESIEALNLGGSGSFIGQNEFTNLKDVDFNIGGSGSIKLDLQADDLSCNIGGAGSIHLEGSAEKIDVNIGGSGSVEAEELSVDQAEVNTAGSGSVSIDVKNTLTATIVGSGGVRYKGDPKVNQTIMGSGRVKAF
jgi:hypothetical protein